jgi:hypothetical protein
MVELFQETHSIKITSCIRWHGFDEEHSAENLAIVHTFADLQIGFAVVD